MSSATNNFKLQICTFWQQNRCRHGPTCRFAHGVKELRNFDGSLVYPPSVPKKVTPKKKPQKISAWALAAMMKPRAHFSKVKPVVKKASFAVLFEDSDSETETESESDWSVVKLQDSDSDTDTEQEHEIIPIKNSGKHSWYDMMQEEFGDNWPPPSNSVYVC